MSEFWHREITHEAAALLEVLPAKGPLYGVELGTLRAKTACILMHRLPELRMVLVDTWDEQSEGPTGEDAMISAIKNLRPFWTRVNLIKCDSTSAAILFESVAFDFVLVDADHVYPKCYRDMEEWWPRIRRGGWLFHHDIDHPDPQFMHWGVRRACEEFSESVGVKFTVNETRRMAVFQKP